MSRKYRNSPLIGILLTLVLAVVLMLGGSGYLDAANTKSERWDWSQWRGPNRDGISHGEGILRNWKKNRPETLWQISPPSASKSICQIIDVIDVLV